MKRIISVILLCSVMLTIIPIIQVSATDAVADTSVFLKQNTSYTCTLSSAAMMLRRRAYLEGNNNWSSITENAIKATAWAPGLYNSFKYAGISVSSGKFTGTASQKKSQLISMLNSHPEGIVIYMYGDGLKTHAILATDYDSLTDTVYCADPANSIAKGRIPLMSAYLTGNTQNARIGNLKKYWYISSGNCVLSTPVATPKPQVHTHAYSYANDTTHPHSQYKYCSCGDKEYMGSKQLISTCTQCYPVGNVSLTRSFEKTKGKAVFYRNNVSNANSYTLKLYKDGNLYDTYTMSSTEYSVRGLTSGKYTATLYAKNTSTGQERSDSCSSFKIADTYTVSYNANGGSNAPSSQTKIEDETLTITNSIPERKGYKFLGWSTGRTSSKTAYKSGDKFNKNADVVLYAIWEPEVYTIEFDNNGGDGVIDSIYLTYGNTTIMPNSIIRDGYYLKGWSTNKDASVAEYKFNTEYTFDKNTTLYAIWGSTNWSGAVASSYAGGSGTENDPYLISDSSELALLAKEINSLTDEPEYKYYKLISNIDLGYNEWVPIGINDTSYQYFKGTFDGDGYTVSGLYISDDSYNYIGLFGYGKNITIKNLALSGDIEDIHIKGKDMYIGGIIGKLKGVYNIFDVCINELDISTISTDGSIYIGLIAGEATSMSYNVSNINNCEIINSYVMSCEADEIYIGGICGSCEKIIYDCSVFADGTLFKNMNPYSKLIINGISNYGAIRCFVEAGRLMEYQTISSDKNVYVEIAGIGGNCDSCSVAFTNKEEINYEGSHVPYSIYIINTTQAYTIISGISTGNTKNCKYDGASLIGKNTYSNGEVGYNNGGYVFVGGISGRSDFTGITRNCIVHVDGIISGRTEQSFSYAGGLTGISVGFSSDTKTISKTLILADAIEAICEEGTTYFKYDSSQMVSGGFAGDIEGITGNTSLCEIEKCYTYEDVLIDATTKIFKNTILKSEDKIKSVSFQTNLLGLTPYKSLENISEDAEAVWILAEDKLPELYYSYLKNIEILSTENGTIVSDKEKAIAGEVVTLTATPDEGYIIDKITVNGEEISGYSFILEEESVIYASFVRETEVYTVSIIAEENASASLTNLDVAEAAEISLMSAEGFTANDGEEIQVDTTADTDYTVDAIYVNGEEIAGDSFIITDNSVVTMDVTSISTEYSAVTNDAEDIDVYSAKVSGSVADFEGALRYIEYWESDNPAEVYTTEVQEGSGEYSIELIGLLSNTEYSYRMTENGEIKTFTTLADGDGGETGGTEENIEPITTTTYEESDSAYVFSIICSQTLNNRKLIVAAYGEKDILVDYAEVVCDGRSEYATSIPINNSIKYFRVFTWSDAEKIEPMGISEMVEMY